jgi:glycosyltransferase involved in cell wall biosynthesis
MKVAYVVPRYGDEVVGGAELAVRLLAERLVAHEDATVEVLTTRAVSARTWANEYPEGEVDLRGVRVRRFTATGRSPTFDAVSGPLLAHPERATPSEQQRWLDLQGPVSADLVDAAREVDADLVVLSPYLFHPTVRGTAAVGNRAVLHPAAHDEATLRLPMFREVFTAARGLVFYTHAEQKLVESRFPVAATAQIVLGLGCDAPPAVPGATGDPTGLGDRPYVVCLGRVESSKGTDALARAFVRYQERHATPVALVFVGPVLDRPLEHPDIVVTGAVDEATKWAILRGAVALVSPSAYESFGLVLLEAWQAGTPVLVNGASDATRELCERSGGGLWFRTDAEFEVALQRIVETPDLRASLAQAGARYVATKLTWPVIVRRYRTFLDSLAGSR